MEWRVRSVVVRRRGKRLRRMAERGSGVVVVVCFEILALRLRLGLV